jgi:hypothetical protein
MLVRAISAGQEQHGNVDQVSFQETTLLSPELPTIHHGHVQVEQNEIRTVFAEPFERFAAMLREHDVVAVA